MKKTFTSRVAAAVGAVAVGLVAVLGAAAPASAANIDGTPVTLTIHKHERSATDPTTPGTGVEVTPAGKGINGVTFNVQAVNGVDLTTDAGWNVVEDIQSKLAVAGATPASALAAAGRTLATAVPVTTATVNGKDGIATLPNAQKTIYLVTEQVTGAPSTITDVAQPFFVTLPQAMNDNTWRYDVHVYPKNAVSSLKKQNVTTDADRAASRDLVRWNITVDVPRLAAKGTFSEFVVSDTINPAYLTFVTDAQASTLGVAPSSVAVTSGSTPAASVALAAGDVTIAVDGATQNKATFSSNGLDTLATKAQGGKVTFTVLTRVTDVPAAGTITNSAGSRINGRVNGTFNGTTTGTPVQAEVQFGDFRVFSHESNGGNAALTGAVYELQDATGKVIKINGADARKTVTDSNGSVVFENLPTGSYQLALVSAPAGYNQVGTSPIAVTVVAGAPVVPTDPKVAGTNYQPVAFSQTPAWALPLTGGDGTAMFMTAGGALVAVALGVMLVVSRRKTVGAQAQI